MKKFIAMLGWMGLVKMENLRDYWSKSPLYDIALPRQQMSRNRFEILLAMWHFADNTEANGNRLHKIENILNMSIKMFKEAFTPGEEVCIDESVIPFRGRLVFRTYNPRKRHKYGIKIYKLCSGKGYTWNFKVYVGQDLNDLSASESVIYKLMGGFDDNGERLPDGLLGEGRILTVDNWYTGVPLALGLMEHKTHLVGTLRTNRKYLPPAVSQTVKKGEVVTRETEEGLTFLKWKDRREVTMLSTNSTNSMVSVTTKRGRVVEKPADVEQYNSGKFSIDMSDQMASYGKALRRCTKWYRKVIIELIWGTMIVNSHLLYNTNTGQNVPIKKFREEIILSLIETAQSVPAPVQRRPSRAVHRLIDRVDGDPPTRKRGRCKPCYQQYGRSGTELDGKKKFAKQVYTICDMCEGNPYMCKSCFEARH